MGKKVDLKGKDIEDVQEVVDEVKVDPTIKKVDSDTANKEKDVKFYENSHLVMYCGKCGSKYIIEENVPKNGGIKIVLPPTSTSEIRLVCKDCKNEMSLFYVEATKKDTTEIKEKANESVSEGSPAETTTV